VKKDGRGHSYGHSSGSLEKPSPLCPRPSFFTDLRLGKNPPVLGRASVVGINRLCGKESQASPATGWRQIAQSVTAGKGSTPSRKDRSLRSRLSSERALFTQGPGGNTPKESQGRTRLRLTGAADVGDGMRALHCESSDRTKESCPEIEISRPAATGLVEGRRGVRRLAPAQSVPRASG